jgi:threonine/homoserine/homoserine lactone efflux protein
MPEPTTLLVFAAAAAALVAVPGPNLVYIATRSVSQGRRSGLASALGIETGTLVHVAAAAAGLSALLASSALAFAVVRYAGAAYLVFLGVRALVRNDAHEAMAAAPPVSLGRAYADGVVVQLLNPKVALFFLAFLPQFADPARGPVAPQILVLGAVLAVLGFIIDVLYALAAGAAGGWLRTRPAVLHRQRYVTGTVYLALGATAALTGDSRS